MVETLSGPNTFTVFAPTDAAFSKLPAGTLESVLEDKQKLTKILPYHVVSGKYTASDLKKLKSVATVQGESVNVEVHVFFTEALR